MTNDELEAVRARADEYVDADQEWLAIRSQRTCPLSRHDKERLLDVAERIASLYARATRAEAHAALLQTEATYWHDKHNQDRLALAASEAHAERLAGALADVQNPACLMMCPDVWPDDTDQPHTIACTNARSALAAYRGVKDEACSRPSDALDAPVEPTSSHLGNGADQ